MENSPASTKAGLYYGQTDPGGAYLATAQRRYDQWPTIFCSQYKTSKWHPRLGGRVVADAILDRIVHNSMIINTGKLNMREFITSHPI